MNRVLDEILQTGRVKSADGDLLDVDPVSIPEEKGRFLQTLISNIRPKTTLEVGLAYGVSALFICDALSKTANACHIIIDPREHDTWKDIGLNNLRAAGYEEMIEFYAMPSYRALPHLDAQRRRIDFAFIDGWHTFDYALLDFFFIDKMLEIGGIVVLDDMDWPAIRKVCRYIVTNHHYKPICMHETGITAKPSQLNLIRHFSHKVQNVLCSELVQSDAQLGLSGECIAFRKEAEDDHLWDFFASF